MHFVSNVYVVKDPKNPENEGKVFLYQYGNKIFQKIMEAMEPVFQDDTPMNPFNLFNGADFKIKIKRVGGYWNYDSSEFASPAPFMSGDEDRIMKILEQTHTISEFTSKDNYKSYAELEAKLVRVLNGVSSTDDSVYSTNSAGVVSSSSSFVENTASTASSESESVVDDDLEYYKQIAAQMNS